MTIRPRTRRLMYVIPLAAALGGCAVDQKKEVATYRKILDENSPGTALPLEPGEQLTLQRAFLLANQANENLALRGEDYLQAIIATSGRFRRFCRRSA